jgi:hypothetical protein
MSATPRRGAKPVRDGDRLRRGYRIIRCVEANCVHTQGEWIGRPFRLLSWQKRWLLELFELAPTGLRRYRWALLETAKKAGKTELAAALAVYLLIGDEEPAPLGACAAASEEQGDLVFGAAKTMCKMSPTLSMVTDVYHREILVPSIPGAMLRPHRRRRRHERRPVVLVRRPRRAPRVGWDEGRTGLERPHRRHRCRWWTHCDACGRWWTQTSGWRSGPAAPERKAS